MKPQVGIVMGSISDWETMKHVSKTLEEFNIESETKIMSAHRTPNEVQKWASTARERGIKVIIAGAGGAAHLAGVIASKTTLPILGVPMMTSSLGGMDSLLSTVQMPSGIPVGTLAIGKAGAINSAVLAAQIISTFDKEIEEKLKNYREEMTKKVLATKIP